jgi:hypothetical protein
MIQSFTSYVKYIQLYSFLQVVVTICHDSESLKVNMLLIFVIKNSIPSL